MTKRIIAPILFLSTLLIAGPVLAEGLVGHWVGHMQGPAGTLQLVVDFDQGEGGLTGWIDVPQQSIFDLPLNDISLEGDKASFTSETFGASFSGTLKDDGALLSGTYTQMGQSIEFELKRTSETPEPMKSVDPAVVKWVGDGVPGKGLAGAWRGALELGSTRLRLQADIAKGEDGALSGQLVSVDQGNAEIPLDSVKFLAPSVRFDIQAIAGTFEGMMNEDGSAIEGQWSQAGQALPLTLKRAPEAEE